MTVRGKRITLTGGAGFIGTALIRRLIEDNEIVVYDSLRRDSLKDSGLAGHRNMTVIKGDVLDAKAVAEAVRGSSQIVHLAAVAGVDTVIKSPTTTMRVNLLGTHNVLEAARTAGGVERLINFSTSEVYGSYAYKLDERNTTAMGAVGEARWTYATSKLAAEHLANAYHREFGLPVVSVRPFNIYGPGQVGEGAIHVFVNRALRGEDIQIHGEGDQIRSWCYIDDIVDGLMLCLERKEAVGEVFNLGNPRGTATILNLAEDVVALAGSKSRLVFTPKNYVDVELRIPDIEKAKRILGFAPKVGLKEGLTKTIEWYRGK